MSLRFAIVIVLLAATIQGTSSRAQTILKSDKFEVRFESCLLRASLFGDRATYRSRLIRDYAPLHRADVPAGGYLSSYPARLYGLEEHELSPATMVMFGAGVGAQAGMFLGALGNTLGLWNENTSWAMVGALSAAGAAWFGAKASDPSWRTVYRWRDDHELAPVKR